MTSILPEKTNVSANQTHPIVPLDGWMDRAPVAWHLRAISAVCALLAGVRGVAGVNTTPTTRDVDGLGLPDTSLPGWGATEVCPIWCEADHALDDPQRKHSHFSDFVEIPLCHDDGNSINGLNVPTLVLDVFHSPETVEPRIQLDCDSDRHWVDMTPDDAESLALHLLDMVKQIKTAGRAACEHDFPLVLTANAARSGACIKCGSPRYA